MVSREQARAERNPDKKPRPAVFRFVPPAKEFKMVLQFRKNHVERDEIIATLLRIIETLEAED
jgi:CRISPR/Cas system CMR subunit Cmr6 (Cas7 group RAMP superfamily)